MRLPVVINWPPSSFHGWGVNGLNLALAWAADPDIEPLFGWPAPAGRLDAAALAQLAPVLTASETYRATLASAAEQPVLADHPVLIPSGKSFLATAAADGVRLLGRPTATITFFETAQLSPDAVRRARAFDLVVTGSRWNEQVLRAHGVDRVVTVHQGVDPSLFHPVPRDRTAAGDRFRVFSGGKLERRKGQDIVLAAFRRFVARRPDALLVTAWNSPFRAAGAGLDDSGLAAPVAFTPTGTVDVRGWVAANGVPPANHLDLGAVPNRQMPQVLHEADVAVFPNRCEGGTNLVAMEAMACGTPTILAANTGHLDLIGDGNCYPLLTQAAGVGDEAPFGEVPGWGESDVDEVVELLEQAYGDRADAARRGASGAATVAPMTWAETARRLKEAVLAARR